MRKAINFDIDTKKYQEYTGKSASNAYIQIRNFFIKNGFKHRQGSGYISNNSLYDRLVAAIIIKMSMEFKWLKYCIKEMDVTNVGKQHSVLNVIKKSIK